MERNSKLLKNATFVLIGNIGSKLMGFIMLPIYTHWLTPTDYGTTDIIGVYASLLLNVVACDISDAIFIFPVGAKTERIKTYYSSGFFFQILCSIICAVVFWGLSQLPYEHAFFSNIWLIYGILISNLFQKYAQDFCRGINKMSVFSFTGIIQSLCLALLSFLFIPSKGVYGYVWAIILTNAITGTFTFIYSQSYKYLSIHSFSKQYLMEMLHFSIPLIPTAILWWLVSSLNRPLLEQYVGIFSIGLLAVGNKLPGLMNLMFNLFQQAWIVTVVEEFKKEDFPVYYNKMFRTIFSTQVLICLLIIMSAKTFVHIMTSTQYFGAWIYIPILSISVLFSNASAFTGTIFSATRKSKFTFYSVIIGGFAAVVFNFLLIPEYGIWGACAAICLAHISSMISRIYFSSLFVKFTNKRYMAKQISILAITYAAALTLNNWMLIPIYATCLSFFIYLNRQTMSEAKFFILNKISKRKK